MEDFDDSEPSMPLWPRSAALLDHFSALSDPRQRWRVLYPLPEILLLVLCATLSGMDDFVEIRLWGDERLDFLRRFLPYERGLPAHDTLNDVINGLDADLFKTCFANWVEALRDCAPDVIAIDGKTSRRSHARGKGREPLHLVSAWAARQRILAAALLLWALFMPPQWLPSAPVTDLAGNCVHLGRAGGHCPPGVSEGASKPADERNCVSLGRAGHFCPAAPP
jgi:hypothetical protein